MILKELDQDFKYGAQTFVVGGMASVPMENGRQFGIIYELDVENESYSSALCGFGREDMRRLPLEDLIPLMTESPAETGQMYVLYDCCDSSEGPSATVLGISASKSALLHLMLEDVKETEEAALLTLCSAFEDPKSDSLWFSYNTDEPSSSFYLCYNIEPVPVYSETKGGAAI